MKNQQSGTFTIVRDCDRYAADIADLVEAAFRAQYGAGDGEVKLIAALRKAGAVVAELAAIEGGSVVGHAMFSRMTAEPPRCHVAGLAPVCARIDRQDAGVGSALIRRRSGNVPGAGHRLRSSCSVTDYYRRFGFDSAKLQGIACAFAGPHLQAIELSAGALDGVTALTYAPAFNAV
ncbi:MAG: N-acetyltransferase [Rhizomicrobium sp.]